MHHTQQQPGRVISIKRFLERREQSSYDLSPTYFTPFTPTIAPITDLDRHRQRPFLKPTACGHRPPSKLSLSQRRLQKNVVKTIIYEFAPKQISTEQTSSNESQANKISKAWMMLAQLVISRSNAIDSSLS